MPMPESYEAALTYLEHHRDAALPNTPQGERAAVVERMREIVGRLYERKPEDLRAAVTMAVDAAKALVAIGIAFFVAIGGFLVQYLMTHDSLHSRTLYCLAAAAALSLVSMIAGFVAIGRAFKNAQGIPPANAQSPTWSTTPLKGPLNTQSYAGVAAIVLFGIGLYFWAATPSGGLAATPAGATTPPPSSGHKLRIEGSWTTLTVRRGGLIFTPPPAASPGQSQAFDIELR
jgi:hypothetical protein